MTNLDPKKVTYTLNIEHDDTPVRGNVLASGNDAIDRQAENKILRRSSPWAWGVVTVRAWYEGIDHVCGADVLGGCSYKNETDFRDCPYFRDMKENAKDDLFAKLQTIARAIGTAERPTCECADPGCPVHKGQACDYRGKKTQMLYRIDMDDRTGTRFCPSCAYDAMSHGIFAELEDSI